MERRLLDIGEKPKDTYQLIEIEVEEEDSEEWEDEGDVSMIDTDATDSINVEPLSAVQMITTPGFSQESPGGTPQVCLFLARFLSDLAILEIIFSYQVAVNAHDPFVLLLSF